MSYTIIERSSRIYNTVAEIFNYSKSSDVVTPIELVRQQVKEVKPTDKVCVPGAGIGTYVLALIEKGVEPSNITAVELDPKYYELGSAMFERFGVNYVNADFLSWKPEMQFDVIVGNPPYQKSREVRNIGAPLWPEFMEKSMNLLRDGGYLGFVIPATWMKRLNGKAWKVIKNNDLVSCDPDVKWAFPEVGGNGGTFSTILLRKGEYQETTSIKGKLSVNFHTDLLPTNNSEFKTESLSFLTSVQQQILKLDVKTGPVNPSINSDHYSSVQTNTHVYNVFYSGAPNRRSMWCDEPVGDYGELKLVVPNSGNVYDNMEITEKGAGRQTAYVLGTLNELEEIRDLLLSEKSQKLTRLMSEGNYVSPLSWVVR
jgi:predicted RNA methylase